MSTEFFIVDPVSGFQGVTNGINDIILIVEPGHARQEFWSLGSFISRNPDFVCTYCYDADDLELTAAHLRDRTIALDFCILLFDSEVRVETKKRIAHELEELFADEVTFSHVADILFAAPLHRSADVSVVGAEWLGAKVGEFIKNLVGSKNRIRNLFAIWAGMKSDPMVEAVGYDVLTGRLISKSFFRSLINSGVTQADVDQLKDKLLTELKDVCDSGVLAMVISEYKKILLPGTRKQRVNNPEDLLDENQERSYGERSCQRCEDSSADPQEGETIVDPKGLEDNECLNASPGPWRGDRSQKDGRCQGQDDLGRDDLGRDDEPISYQTLEPKNQPGTLICDDSTGPVEPLRSFSDLLRFAMKQRLPSGDEGTDNPKGR